MLERVDSEAVLKVVQTRGPVLPLDVRKALGRGDLMLIGATLSVLVAEGKVAITTVRRGGSPFYYDPTQPASLEKVWENLGEKDRRTYTLLKEKRVLRADELDPLTRVGLSLIKDYAKPLQVTAGAQQLLFYKYFLVDDKEAEMLIKSVLGLAPKEPEKIEKKRDAAEEKKDEKKDVKKEKNDAREEKRSIGKEEEHAPEKTIVSEPVEKTIAKPVKKKAAKTAERSAEQQMLSPVDATSSVSSPLLAKDEFLKKIADYCAKNGITIKSAAVIKKNADLDLVISVPSPVGTVEYYCKARAKKKSGEQDIAAALEQGMQRKLATLYLTTGEVSKKGKEYAQASRVIVKEL